MKTSATNKRIRVLLTDLREERLEPSPEFQRRLVWSNKDKSSFIETVLKGLPFPEIYVAPGVVDVTTAASKELLVDGQQRLTTLDQYFRGAAELTLTAGIPSYKELTADQQRSFLDYEVVVRDLGTSDIAQIKEVFERINSTKYALNAMEIHNARFQGAFKSFGDDIASLDFFERHRVFSNNELKRMLDTKFALLISATIIGGYFNRDDTLKEFLEVYNDDFPKANEVRNLIEGALGLIEECRFPADCRVWKKADLFTAIVEFAKYIEANPNGFRVKKFAPIIRDFYEAVDSKRRRKYLGLDLEAYRSSALQANADRGNRVRRATCIVSILGHATPA